MVGCSGSLLPKRCATRHHHFSAMLPAGALPPLHPSEPASAHDDHIKQPMTVASGNTRAAKQHGGGGSAAPSEHRPRTRSSSSGRYSGSGDSADQQENGHAGGLPCKRTKTQHVPHDAPVADLPVDPAMLEPIVQFKGTGAKEPLYMGMTAVWGDIHMGDAHASVHVKIPGFAVGAKDLKMPAVHCSQPVKGTKRRSSSAAKAPGHSPPHQLSEVPEHLSHLPPGEPCPERALCAPCEQATEKRLHCHSSASAMNIDRTLGSSEGRLAGGGSAMVQNHLGQGLAGAELASEHGPQSKRISDLGLDAMFDMEQDMDNLFDGELAHQQQQSNRNTALTSCGWLRLSMTICFSLVMYILLYRYLRSTTN